MARFGFLVLGVLALLATPAWGVVFINEVLINPPGSGDELYEFIELQGTPGMKLDGYAVAIVNGTLRKFYPLHSLPPVPAVHPEVDEFFSLDGLALGGNGLLVLTNDVPGAYSTILADTAAVNWDTRWNGGLDTSGKFENDGSDTVLLIRNRPGITQANPGNPAGLRWGKDVPVDGEVISPAEANVCIGGGTPGEPCKSVSDCLGPNAVCGTGSADQLGDGNVDRGDPNNYSGSTLDLKGAATLVDASDDLEVVDEVSYEHEQGWEYDLDERHVDADSASNGLPYRHVHALDDGQGFNADCLTRVDYRTKGSGWAPTGGAVGELLNGNNWQDTATEQWIRGETANGSGGQGGNPQIFFSSAANADPNAIQPYKTNVPVWLADGAGVEYSFAASAYQVMAGRVNPLAVPFIPGDADRDGDCDADDIAKIAGKFGDPDWIFSNSFHDAPVNGDESDPADPTRPRPWDVDATGDNGVDPSDLQWTLNFQGDTTGRVVGKRYDSTTPSATGVVLNISATRAVTMTAGVVIPSGRASTDLRVGNLVQLTVSGQVTDGPIVAAGQQNGVMQFVQDVALDAGGVLRVVKVEKLGVFATTRGELEVKQGASGDRGVVSVNGYTTSFTQGLESAAGLYLVTLRAIGLGTTHVAIAPAAAARLSASTPKGVKMGHTDHNGNPNVGLYPAALTFAVTDATATPGDWDGDGDVDLGDYAAFGDCLTGPGGGVLTDCGVFNFDADADVDLKDFAAFARAM